jgi:hypothetical protein
VDPAPLVDDGEGGGAGAGVHEPDGVPHPLLPSNRIGGGARLGGRPYYRGHEETGGEQRD